MFSRIRVKFCVKKPNEWVSDFFPYFPEEVPAQVLKFLAQKKKKKKKKKFSGLSNFHDSDVFAV